MKSHTHSRSSSPSDPPQRARPHSSELPEPHRVVRWLYVGRVLLGAALFAPTPDASRFVDRIAEPVALFAFLFAGLSFWHTHRRHRPPGETFLYGQLIFDALLVTLVVQATGGAESAFAPLYILLLGVAALLLTVRGGTLVGLLAIALYLASTIWGSGGTLESAVGFQIGLFVIVALVTGYLGARLRAAGTALGEVQTELAQLRLDTSDILNTMNTGVLTVDGEGALVYMNPAAEEMLDVSSEDWVGKPVLEHLDEIAPGLGEVLSRSARDQLALHRFETSPAAEDSFVLGVSTTLVDRLGEAHPVVTAIFQDITEKKRVEALRRRAERLEAIAGLSASLAHEIKNPLASIRSAVEQIASGQIDRDDDQLLKALVMRESDRLSRLLTEFIDFARVKVTAPEPVDLLPLVRDVVQLVRSHPDAQGRTIEVSVPEAVDQLRIRGAEDLLHRAMFNLVLNAVQWAGAPGEVRLSLDEVRSDLLSPALGALSLIRVTVTDSGPGVPEAIVDSIFDPFFTRRPGGSGLGLALVQRAVEAHSGAIFVDNGHANTGIGATFTLYLPALPSLPAGAGRVDAAPSLTTSHQEEPHPL
ncbi:MAG: PAS domain S-box protein [Gemmatimonadetes bacterium]|nr:PAS domain S-box protein [Gemmatimonadota bacterium]